MPKECKKYNLRSTRKPARSCLLASVVRVRNEEGKDGYCYVGFDEALVEAVGKKLSRGVAPFDPAYLVAEYDPRRSVWLIGACYFYGAECVKLWETPDRPEWLKFIEIGGNNGSHPQNKNSARPAARSTGSKARKGSGDPGSSTSPGSRGTR